MALSLALNWSPPPSSPLFDEGLSQTASGEGGETSSNNKQQLGYSTSPPRLSSGPNSSSSNTSDMDRRRRAEQQALMSPSSSNGSLTGQGPSSRNADVSSQPRTYASAASHSHGSRSASTQQVNMPSYPTAAMVS